MRCTMCADLVDTAGICHRCQTRRLRLGTTQDRVDILADLLERVKRIEEAVMEMRYPLVAVTPEPMRRLIEEEG